MIDPSQWRPLSVGMLAVCIAATSWLGCRQGPAERSAGSADTTGPTPTSTPSTAAADPARLPAVLRPAPAAPDPVSESFTASALRRQELLERFSTAAINVGCHGVNDPLVPSVRVDIDVSADGEILVSRIVPKDPAPSEAVLACARTAAGGLEGTRIEAPGRAVSHRFQRRLRLGAPPDPPPEPELDGTAPAEAKGPAADAAP